MKLATRARARTLRTQGYSIRAITEKLAVSKASVSRWVADISLSHAQLKTLKGNPYSDNAIEKRRASRLHKERLRRSEIIRSAERSINLMNRDDLFYLGIALYWGEGTKSKRGVVEFTNSDPKMIQVMMEFYRHVCKVPREKFRGRVHLHGHLPILRAESFWSTISGIPASQFHKTSVQHNRSRTHKDTLPYGTFAVVICDTELRLRMAGWTEGVYKKLISPTQRNLSTNISNPFI